MEDSQSLPLMRRSLSRMMRELWKILELMMEMLREEAQGMVMVVIVLMMPIVKMMMMVVLVLELMQVLVLEMFRSPKFKCPDMLIFRIWCAKLTIVKFQLFN
jgi:hypothetical protein